MLICTGLGTVLKKDSQRMKVEEVDIVFGRKREESEKKEMLSVFLFIYHI